MTQQSHKAHTSLVQACARCTKDHYVTFFPFTRPPPEVSHWGECPNTKEPILMWFVETPDE